MLMADIVENLLLEKNVEIKILHERLRDAKSNLAITVRDSDINLNNLKIQLSEKYKTVQDIEQQMANLQKVCVKTFCLHVYCILFQNSNLVIILFVLTIRNQ